jgi:hypothetical protein
MDHKTTSDHPITGFALFADGSLHLQRGYGQRRFQPCRPDQLAANDFKALLWAIEAALGACHNELQQTEPSSIHSVLRVMAICHANRPPDPCTGAVMTWVRPHPICCTADDAQPSRGGLRQSMAGLLPRPSFCAGVHPPRVGRLGLVPEAGRAAVA